MPSELLEVLPLPYPATPRSRSPPDTLRTSSRRIVGFGRLALESHRSASLGVVFAPPGGVAGQLEPDPHHVGAPTRLVDRHVALLGNVTFGLFLVLVLHPTLFLHLGSYRTVALRGSGGVGQAESEGFPWHRYLSSV